MQPNAQNTYETHIGSGADGFLYIDNYNITTQESARFQFSRNGQIELGTISNTGVWNLIAKVLTSADIGFFDVSRIDFISNLLTGESVIKFGISPTRTDQIVVNDQGIRLDRWDGNTWTNIWTK